MEGSRYRERVLDSRIYHFEDPVTFKRYALQEEIVEVQEVPQLVESRFVVANSRNKQIAVERHEPLTESGSWWGCLSMTGQCQPCCESKSEPIELAQKQEHRPYISPLRLGQRQRKPWTTFRDKVTMGVAPEASFLA